MSTTMPADVKARLLQAATEVMTEREFAPLSQRDLEVWMARNAQAVGQRAKDLQEQLLVKVLERHGEVVAVISESVYRQIRKNTKREEN